MFPSVKIPWRTLHSGLDSKNSEVRWYHMDLGIIYQEIEKVFGSIDSFVSDLDFQLNAGAAQTADFLVSGSSLLSTR